jgi:hypothetical protein
VLDFLAILVQRGLPRRRISLTPWKKQRIYDAAMLEMLLQGIFLEKGEEGRIVDLET